MDVWIHSKQTPSQTRPTNHNHNPPIKVSGLWSHWVSLPDFVILLQFTMPMETRKEKNAHKDEDTDSDHYTSNSEEEEDEEMCKYLLIYLFLFRLPDGPLQRPSPPYTTPTSTANYCTPNYWSLAQVSQLWSNTIHFSQGLMVNSEHASKNKNQNPQVLMNTQAVIINLRIIRRESNWPQMSILRHTCLSALKINWVNSNCVQWHYTWLVGKDVAKIKTV